LDALHHKISLSGHKSVAGLQSNVPVISHSLTSLYT